MATTTVGRNPFARGEYERHSMSGVGFACYWCGQTRRTLYTYTWVSDGGSRGTPRGHFCNLDCFRAYHS